MTLIQRSISNAGGWLGFDRFMALALYAPGMGYYANGLRKFGTTPQTGSDFVTAPEMSPHFGRALANQVREALQHTQTERCGSLVQARARWRCNCSRPWVTM